MSLGEWSRHGKSYVASQLMGVYYETWRKPKTNPTTPQTIPQKHTETEK